MKVLILEDNPKDTQFLKNVYKKSCAKTHSFHEVYTYDDMETSCKNNDYDLVFMNIDLDPKIGFDFIKLKATEKAEMIITAQNEDKMLEAYKHSIAGFLTKPISEEAFCEILKRVDKKVKLCNEEKVQEYDHFKDLIAGGEINRIVLTTLDGYVIVHYDEIIRCEANGNYTSVYFHDGSFLMLTKTLKHYASKLEQHGFFRVHKTHLVNLDYVRSYVKGKNSYVELKDGSHIEVSSRKKQILVEILNN